MSNSNHNANLISPLSQKNSLQSQKDNSAEDGSIELIQISCRTYSKKNDTGRKFLNKLQAMLTCFSQLYVKITSAKLIPSPAGVYGIDVYLVVLSNSNLMRTYTHSQNP